MDNEEYDMTNEFIYVCPECGCKWDYSHYDCSACGSSVSPMKTDKAEYIALMDAEA